MRLLFKLLLSAALGFAVVAVLVVVLPTPKTSSSFLATSGFFPEGKVTQLNAEQLRTQFLYANLDAQQSAIAEEHLLSGVLAEYEQFLSELDVGEQAKQRISAALMQAQRELTDYRLAQSMEVIGDRQLGYSPAQNYVLKSLEGLLTPPQALRLQELQRQFAWERFGPSYQARIDAFALSLGETFPDALRAAIIEAQFAHSYELDSPHALGLATPAQRLESQLAALAETERALKLAVASEEFAPAQLFIDHERRQLKGLRSLL